MKKYIMTIITSVFFLMMFTINIYGQKGFAWKKFGSGISSSCGSNQYYLKGKYIDGNLYIAVLDYSNYATTIYKWNGSSWSNYPALQGAQNYVAFVYDIEIFKDELYVCGNIRQLNGLQRAGNKSLGVVKFNGTKWDSLPSYPTFKSRDSMELASNLCTYKSKLYYIVNSPRDKLFSLDTFGTTNLIITHTKIFNSGFVDLDIIKDKLVIAGNIDSVMYRQKTSGMFYFDGTNFSFTKYKKAKQATKFFRRNDSQYLVVTPSTLEFWEGDSMKKDITPPFNWFHYYSDFTFHKNLIIASQDTICSYYDTDSSKWFRVVVNASFAVAVPAGPDKAIMYSCPLFQGAAELTLGGIVSGKLYFDRDSNCTINTGDAGVNYTIIEFDNGTDKAYTASDNNGNYEISVLPGTHNVTYHLPDIKSSIAPCSAVSVTVAASNTYTGINIPMHPSRNRNLSAAIDAYRGFRTRQGFTETYVLTGANHGYFNDSLILKLKYPTKVTFVKSSVTPYSNTSNELIYKFYNVGFRETKSINIQFSTSVNTINVGDTVKFYASVVNSTADSVIENNYDTLCQKVVAAYDPNIKQCFPEGKVTPGLKKIKYQIHFQNTGNDTAFKVTVIDTITQKLGLRSLRVTGTSHPKAYSLRVDNKQALIWEFNNIMLPDSHINEKASHGFIAFEADINGVLAIGDSITNKAFIYFDYQKPIITNTASIVMVNPTTNIQTVRTVKENAMVLYPNPTSDMVHITADKQYDQNKVLLFNSMGQIVGYQKLNEGTATFDVSGLAKGIYFVKIEGTDIAGKLLVE